VTAAEDRDEAYVAHCVAIREARRLEVAAMVADDWQQRMTGPYRVADHATGWGST
jgi:hypothetical protein